MTDAATPEPVASPPASPPSPPDAPPPVPTIYAHTSFTVRRKVFKIFGAAFHIYDPQGNVAFYSSLKAFKLREEIRLFASEAMQEELLSIRARQILDIAAVYDVVDSRTGEKVGAVKRKGLKSILKDEWILMDTADNEIGMITEDSMALALVRRFLTNLIPQTFQGTVNGKDVCVFKQNFNPFVLKVNLDFSPDKTGELDRRLGIAAAVLLCAIEGRQN